MISPIKQENKKKLTFWQNNQCWQFNLSDIDYFVKQNLHLGRFFVEKFFTKSEKVLREFFSTFFRESVYFQLKRRESEKKIHKKKNSPKFEKYLKNLRSWKFSHVRRKLTFDVLNWFRNPPCQFNLSFSKIDRRFLRENVWAKCPIYKKSPCIQRQKRDYFDWDEENMQIFKFCFFEERYLRSSGIM